MLRLLLQLSLARHFFDPLRLPRIAVTKLSLRRVCARIVFLVFPVLLAAPAFGQEAEGLSELQTRSLVNRYEEAKHWSLRGIVLLALGERWHPNGAPMVTLALTEKDRHLRAYALAALRNTDAEHIRSVATPELIDTLIKTGLRDKDEHYRAEVFGVLEMIFPDQSFEKRGKWERYWRENKEGYTMAPWVGPEPVRDFSNRRSTAATVVQRAMDLYEAGLDVAICIDSTGSMQSTIDASRDAVADIVSILKGVSPEFRLGLVHYKDFGDMGKIPAKVLEPLSKKPQIIEKRLSKLSAGGGGDAPERVEVGLEVALSQEMGWKRETNKLIVLIGDAPPHGGTPMKDAVKLAKEAFEKPFGVDPTDIKPEKRTRRTKTNKVVRGFVTAAIAVGADKVADQTKSSFKRIAEAGGGAFASLLTDEGPDEASREIARHIMRQSFGTQWKKQMDQFVDVYFEFHDREYFD